MIRSFLKKNYLGIVIGLVLFTGLYLISLYSYILYHSLVELFSIVIAFGIFVIAWNSKKFFDNNYFLFIGIAYFFVALLDLIHTLAYKGMGVFVNFEASNIATQLWISARFLESISVLIALFFITRRLNYRIQFISYFILTLLILLSIFYWEIFPDSYIEGIGLTSFKIISEYVIAFMLAAAIFFLYLYRNEFSKTIFMLLIASLVFTILSELSFTLYTDVYGLFNQLGHFLKVISFFLIYKAIIEIGLSQPLDLLFFKLQQREKEVKESEAKFHSLFASMGEGVSLYEIVYDHLKNPVDYIVIDVNKAYESIIGLSRNQVIGKKVSVVYKTDIAPYMDLYASVANSGKSIKFEAYFKSIEKYFSVSVFSPSSGKIATTFSDITQNKKFEKELESVSKLVLENPNPVMRMDDTNLIIFANNPAKSLLNQLGEEKEKEFIKLLEDSVNAWKKNQKAKLNTVELRIGNLFYEFIIVPIEEFDYFNIYGIDITNRKKAEILRDRIKKEKILTEERKKLARELHDTVTQTLFSSNLLAGVIPKLLKKNPKDAFEKIEEVKQLNNIALAEMRILLYELRPSVLKSEDLGNLLKGLIKTIGTRTKLPIELKIEGNGKFKPKLELAYYRIAQEALNNLIKHSGATKARILLKMSPKKIYMHIIDNGCGFDSTKTLSTNLGLKIMKERARLIGAYLNIKSYPDKGTKITLIYDKNKYSRNNPKTSE